jgi:GNAT superfamily N-acetyltransferase
LINTYLRWLDESIVGFKKKSREHAVRIMHYPCNTDDKIARDKVNEMFREDEEYKPFLEASAELAENYDFMLLYSSNDQVMGYAFFVHPNQIFPVFCGLYGGVEKAKLYVSERQNELYSETRNDAILGNKGWCVFMRIFIKPPFRNRGLGKQLLEKYIQFCSQENFLKMVNSPNENFLQFSQKINFKEGYDWFREESEPTIDDR